MEWPAHVHAALVERLSSTFPTASRAEVDEVVGLWARALAPELKTLVALERVVESRARATLERHHSS